MQKNTADFMVTIAVVAMIADTFHAQETEEEEEEEAAAQCMIRHLVEHRKLCGEFSEQPEKQQISQIMFCAILIIGAGNFHGRHVSRFANSVIKTLVRLLHIDLASLIAAGASRKSEAWHLEDFSSPSPEVSLYVRCWVRSTVIRRVSFSWTFKFSVVQACH